ncbi:hypothetical protein CEXT_77601 [Caerostris extrusa]|uniref:Uncharacterized protein n=1 Tax=Caerostris extrusa TaxID=172846 RepID=A0AAV4R5S8_CAEEX|nr:hypothetical protein CEXT_77601 [Caerostris extrusa]
MPLSDILVERNMEFLCARKETEENPGKASGKRKQIPDTSVCAKDKWPYITGRIPVAIAPVALLYSFFPREVPMGKMSTSYPGEERIRKKRVNERDVERKKIPD